MKPELMDSMVSRAASLGFDTTKLIYLDFTEEDKIDD